MSPRRLRVERTGPGVLVEDLGRIGWAQLGVTRSGAADLRSLRRANRLVGNAEGAAGLEILIGGLEVVATAHLVVAVTGATCPVRIDGRPVPREAVLDLPAGCRLSLGTAATGLRAYLAVRGGVDVPPVLGSRSFDTLAGLGPSPVAPGDVLPVGPATGPLAGERPRVDVVPVAGWTGPEDVVVLRAVPGPRVDWLTAGALDHLWGPGSGWRVSADADRVGLRLTGPVLARDEAHRQAELPSEGLVRGAVQVPPGDTRCSFSRTIPSRAGTRSSRPCWTPTSTSPPSCGRGSG